MSTAWLARPTPGGRLVSGRMLLSCLSGLLYVAAFPGAGLWPLGFVALVPLLVALEKQAPRRALGFGSAAGFVASLVGFYWLVPVLGAFSGLPSPLSVVAWVMLSAYHALRLGLVAWLSARATRLGWPRAPTFAAAFLASELAFPLIFPWYFGAVLVEVPELIQLAELAGVRAVSLVLVLGNFCCYACLEAWRTRSSLALSRAALSALLLGAIWTHGALRIRSVDEQIRSAPTAAIGIVQANIRVAEKLTQPADLLRRHAELSRALVAAPTAPHGKPLELVLWPESAHPGPLRAETAGERFSPHVDFGVPVLAGAVVDAVDANGRARRFNSALLFDARGELVDRYDKRELLPFAEYVPLGVWFSGLHALLPAVGHFSPGTRNHALAFGDRRIATLICYEDVLPSSVRRLVAETRPSLLVNLSNDAWFGATSEPRIHHALAAFRSIEHRRFLVRANNSGISAVIDPVGRTLTEAEPSSARAFHAEVAWLDSNTAYTAVGDLPAWVVAAAGLLGAFVVRPRLRTSGAPNPQRNARGPEPRPQNTQGTSSVYS